MSDEKNAQGDGGWCSDNADEDQPGADVGTVCSQSFELVFCGMPCLAAAPAVLHLRIAS
jgi:hypothetical protein